MMNKKVLLAGLMLSAGLLCGCSNEDGDNGGSTSGNNSIMVEKTKVTFKQPYYGHEGTDCAILFPNFDMSKPEKMPKKYSMLAIYVPSNGNDIPLGTFKSGEYDVTLVVNSDWETENFDYYLEEDEVERPTGDLVINKNGSKYTITINELNLVGEKDGNDGDGTFSTTTSFKYSGSIKRLPSHN